MQAEPINLFKMKDKIKSRQKQIVELVQGFCQSHLNEEYAALCEKVVLKLGRKRNVPFERGDLKIWAASVVHAVGGINFLFDSSSEPHLEVNQIHEHFGTKPSTVSGKSKKIRDWCDMYYYCKEFSTSHLLGNNPFNRMVMVDGFMVPLSTLPENLQEEVRQARAAGHDIEFTTE